MNGVYTLEFAIISISEKRILNEELNLNFKEMGKSLSCNLTELPLLFRFDLSQPPSQEIVYYLNNY